MGKTPVLRAVGLFLTCLSLAGCLCINRCSCDKLQGSPKCHGCCCAPPAQAPLKAPATASLEPSLDLGEQAKE